ncbi:hypothetical protein LXL04_005910 [Taraxacum kok-saghyz]
MDRDQLQRIFQMFDKNGDARITEGKETKTGIEDRIEDGNGRRPKRRPTQLKTEGNEDGSVFPAIGTAIIREKLERFGEWERRFQFCRKNEASIWRWCSPPTKSAIAAASSRTISEINQEHV